MQTNLQWKEIKSGAYKLLTPSINLLKKTGITPNIITSLGFIITIASSVILVIGGEIGERGDHRYIAWFAGWPFSSINQ